MDNIKRNPNRNKDIDISQYQNYKPEYQKLNRQPIKSPQEQLDLFEGNQVEQEEQHEEEQYTEQEHNEFVNDQYFELGVGQCMLTIYGEVVKIGTIDTIKKEVSIILNGQHPKYDQSIELSDLVVLKRLNIRYGVMVE